MPETTRSGKRMPDLSHAEWQRSTFSEGEGSHVEIAFADDMIAMRDSQHPEGPVLIFTPAEWDAFVGGAKDGEFDLDDELDDQTDHEE